MTRLEKLITIRSRTVPSKHTTRRLITFKTSSSYKRCLQYLMDNGAPPFKRLPKSRMLGCHFTKHRSWKAISIHPDVQLIEKDAVIKMHGINRKLTVPLYKNKSSLLHTKLHTNINPIKLSWNIASVKAPAAWKVTLGSPVKVAIIDTGIANHPDLQIAGGVNTINGGSYADDNGHGTHVAGIAAGKGLKSVMGVAPDVKLYAVKALDSEGSGYVSDIVDGIEWCIRNKMNIINMSFGIIGGEASGALRNVIKRAVNNGIIIIASAGNAGPSNKTIEEPASYSETIAVAASTSDNRIADFSSRGQGINLTAPGEDIRSTWLNGTYLTMSGSSMSSPHVTGGAALLLSQKPSLRPAQVKEQLRQWAIQLNGYPTTAQGSGLVQLDRLGASDSNK